VALGELAIPAKKRLSVSGEYLEVDGSRFHLVWLRDNCRCATCQDSATLQKLFDITTTDLTPRIQSYVLDEVHLDIVWDEGPPHHTRYRRSWLRSHAYDLSRASACEVLSEEPELWHAWPSNERALPEARAPDDPNWREDVHRYGFALIRDLSADKFLSFLGTVGPITPTEFGQVAPLQARPDANDLGETGCPLDPHTDYSVYMHFPPVLSFLHCLQNDTDGGVSILVDGFAAAQCFRQAEPHAFELLVRSSLPFHQLYQRWHYHHLRHRPIIELDADGRIYGVYAGHPHTRNWHYPFEQMIPLYEAYSSFVRLLNDRSRQLHYRLKPGECLIFRNERVLHGRTGFSPESGERHLQIAYVNWSYFTARHRFARTGSAEFV
jgi:alpha-ketoglutarate-dependent taurine dioxygenase